VHREALLVGWLAHNVHCGLEDVGGPLDEPSGEAAVGEHIPDRVVSTMLSRTVLPPRPS
jgi:hypothetical protein